MNTIKLKLNIIELNRIAMLGKLTYNISLKMRNILLAILKKTKINKTKLKLKRIEQDTIE